MSFCFPSVKKNNNQKPKKTRGLSNVGRWFGDVWPSVPTVSPACRRRLKVPNLSSPLALTHPPPSFSLLLSLYYYYNHDYSQYQCLCYQFYYLKRFYHGSMIIIVVSTLRARTHTRVCLMYACHFIEYLLKATKAKRKGGYDAIVEDGWRFYSLLPCDTVHYCVTVG